MSTFDVMPQLQEYIPPSRATWVWPIITYGLMLSTVGFWVSAFTAISYGSHLQIIGSGWWQYSAMGMSGLLFALIGFSGKMSVLIARRGSPLLGLLGTTFLNFNIEALGLALFIDYGVLPLCIHAFSEPWIMISIWILQIGFWLVKRKMPRLSTIAVPWLGDRPDAASLVADPSRLSRRALISGGLILGIGASGLAAVWRALPTLIPNYTFFGHDDSVHSLSWFPDGRRIASITYDGQLFIWNAADGSNRRMLSSMASTLTKVQVSPDAKLLAVSDSNSIYMLDVATGAALWNTEIWYSERPFSWAPDSARVVVISQHDVRTIDAVTGEEATTAFVPPRNFPPGGVAWSPDGKAIAATDGIHVVLWNASSAIQRETFVLPSSTTDDLWDFAWSPNGAALAIAVGHAVYVWFLHDTALSMAYREHTGNIFGISISWSPDGRYIASCGSQDNTVRVWEAATGKTVFVYNGHFSFVNAVAWSPDGRHIASGGYDKLVHVWQPILPA